MTGDRYYSVIHCRLLNKSSNPNFNLYTNHLRDDPFCEHCNEPEDSENFLLRCRRNKDARQIMFQNTRPYHTLSTVKLLYRNPLLNDKENAIIFKEVQRSIKSTDTFRQWANFQSFGLWQHQLFSFSSFFSPFFLYYLIIFFLRNTVLKKYTFSSLRKLVRHILF